MSFLLKDPSAILDYSVDWGAEYLGGDAIADSSWQVAPVEAGGATVVGSEFDFTTATVKAGGGVPGHQYRLTNHVVTVSGREDERTIVLRVEQR